MPASTRPARKQGRRKNARIPALDTFRCPAGSRVHTLHTKENASEALCGPRWRFGGQVRPFLRLDSEIAVAGF